MNLRLYWPTHEALDAPGRPTRCARNAKGPIASGDGRPLPPVQAAVRFTPTRPAFRRPSTTGFTLFRLFRGRIPFLEAAYLEDLDSECLEPGEKAIQRRLIPQGTVQDGFDRFH